MLATILIVLGALLPIAIVLYNQLNATKPSLRWPKIAPMLKLQFVNDGVIRMEGPWNGKKVTVIAQDGAVLLAAQLSHPSRLRLEVGPKDVVAKRAGMVVPDAVTTGDPAFEERLLARCSDKNEGQAVFDAVLRQRLLAQAHVDILGQGDNVQWSVPTANDPDQLEQMLDIMSVLATEMERFPA